MDHVDHEDTGQDSGLEDPIISAAEQAGEQGGISCQSVNIQYDPWAPLVGFFLGIFLVLRRKK